MPALIEYLIKLSICLAVVYIFYQLLLRRLTFYNWNRWYLLGYSAMSFIIPLINIMPQLRNREMEEAVILTWIPSWQYVSTEKQNIFETLSYWDWTFIALASGTIFFLARFIIKLYSFLLIRNKAKLITKFPALLYQLDENITPFSFGKAIFINQHLHSEEELAEIIRHEFIHVKQKHTIDIVFAELLCITNWFNPFAWLIRHSIKQNLEFIADNKVVQNGFDKKEYQYLLLKVMGNKQYAFTTHFNFSNLKKRIAMMNTLKTTRVHLIKFLFLLPIIAVLLLSFRKEIQKAEVKKPVTFAKDTVPDKDSGYKISVIISSGSFLNPKMNRKIIDRISIDDWNRNNEYYGKKYGKPGIIRISEHKNKDGEIVKFDSVYVTKYRPKPIKPGEEPLIILDGKEMPYATMNSITPEDMESVNILKDTAATLKYGEKGKNGAIIIETKKEENQSGLSDSSKVTRTFKGTVSGILVQESPTGNTGTLQPAPQQHGKVTVKGSQGNEITKDPKSHLNFKIEGSDNKLMILDGKEITNEELKKVNPDSINEISILKDKYAIEKYGDKGKSGVMELTSKKMIEKKRLINFDPPISVYVALNHF